MFTILLADDEENILRSTKKLFLDAFPNEIRVLTAKNGVECYHLFQTEKIDLLLLDIKMPGMNGVELVERIRQTDQKAAVIILSAYAEFEYAQKFIRYGVTDYLIKPVEVSRLLTVVRSVMQRPERMHDKETEIIPQQEEAFYDCGKTHTLVTEAKAYMKEHVYEPLTLSVVAEALHINKAYLCDMFKKETEINMSSYINNLKVAEAKKLLLETRMSVNEIAEKLNYSSSRYFIEKFTKSTGITPAKFRNMLNETI